MLDLVLKEDPLVIGSAHGKKKKKSAENLKPGYHYDVVSKGEQALYFLSSLLDVLLLKKDIANRSAIIRDTSLFICINVFLVLDKFLWNLLNN